MASQKDTLLAVGLQRLEDDVVRLGAEGLPRSLGEYANEGLSAGSAHEDAPVALELSLIHI